MNLHLPDWIDAYLKYTDKSEAPDHFHKWTALSLISGALQRKVWIDFGYDNIYPNLYIVLVAHPGKARKSAAVSAGRKILSKVKGVTLGAEATTIEQLIFELASSLKTFKKGDGNIISHSSMTLMSGELGSLIQTNNAQKMITILTDWYDCKTPWENKTKNKGNDTILGSCLNIIGCTTPDWLAEFLPVTAVGGGFTSRCVFVYGDKIRRPNPRPILTPEHKILQAELTSDLSEFSKLHGEMDETTDAHAFMNDWYIDLCKQEPLVLDRRFGGFYARKQLHTFKLAMCIAVGRTGKLTLRREHYQEAIKMLEEAEPGFIRAFGGMGTSTLAKLTHEVREFIQEKQEVSREELFISHWRDATVKDMDDVLLLLETTGQVETERTLKGKLIYKWKEQKRKK